MPGSNRYGRVALGIGLLSFAAVAPAQQTNTPPRVMTVQDLLRLPSPPPDHRIPYGDDPLQFGDLRLPEGEGPHPVAVVIHGGCWLAQYDIGHIGSLLEALRQAGVATWALEYRRVGNPGGGWPGTFQDIARGTDHLRVVAREHPLDLGRVLVVGHSAGGHLALWVAARHRLPKHSPLFSPNPLPVQGVLSLAGVADLRRRAQEKVCGDAIPRLMGGLPAEVPQRYEQASPIALLPLGVPQILLYGAHDRIVPARFGSPYEAAARRAGDPARAIVLEDAGHFELVAPHTSAWKTVKEAVLALLAGDPRP